TGRGRNRSRLLRTTTILLCAHSSWSVPGSRPTCLTAMSPPLQATINDPPTRSLKRRMSDGFEPADVPKGPITISPVKKAILRIPIRIHPHPMFPTFPEETFRGTELPLVDVAVPLYTTARGSQGVVYSL